jgi:uncharacterized membrane protein YgcG
MRIFIPMMKHRWMRAIPLVLGALLFIAPAKASEIHDRAGMFSRDAVKKTQMELDRIERATGVPVVIETIESLPGLNKSASTDEKRRAINSLAVKRDKEIKDEGIFVLISKDDKLISNVLARKHLEKVLTEDRLLQIRNSFRDGFKAGRFDEGLSQAAATIEKSLANAKDGTLIPQAGAPHGLPGPRKARAGGAGNQQFGLGSLLTIGLGILGVLFVIRIIGGMFGRSSGGYPSQMGMGGMQRPGMGPGFGGPGYGGPGYGAPGYSGRGGGFFSGMLGGIGGALAGNWLYDQFSGRHGSSFNDASNYGSGGSAFTTDPANDPIIGADADGGMGTSWDDPATDGGGDWGGGDGGGDWGGGGGDWGGGGDNGDW